MALTTKQLAAELQVHPETVLRMAQSNTIPFQRANRRGDYRFDLAQVKAALNNQQGAPAHAQ